MILYNKVSTGGRLWGLKKYIYIYIYIYGFIWGRIIPYAYAQSNFKERSPFKTCWAYTSVTDAYPEHMGQELMRTLSMWNWSVAWAYASVSYVYALQKRKNSKFEKGLQSMLSNCDHTFRAYHLILEMG